MAGSSARTLSSEGAVIRTSTSPAVSAVFVDEAGHRRRYMVILGRAALAVLVVATAAMVTALLTGARLPLLGLPDGVAAPAERVIRALSDLPRPVAEQPAGRRPQAGGPLPVSTPASSAAGGPSGPAVDPVDAAIAGPTTDGRRPAGTGEAPTGPGGGRPVTTPAPEPVGPGRPATSGQPSAPARTPAKAQGRTPTKAPAKPATPAKGATTPAKPSRPAASSKPGRSPGATRRPGPPETARTRPAAVRSATRPAAGQDPGRPPAQAQPWPERG